ERVDQLDRLPRAAEAADHDGRAIRNAGHGGLDVRHGLVDHRSLLVRVATRVRCANSCAFCGQSSRSLAMPPGRCRDMGFRAVKSRVGARRPRREGGAMLLTDEEKGMRDGAEGAAVAAAMDLLIRYGEALGAERLCETRNVAGTMTQPSPAKAKLVAEGGWA